MSVDPWHEVKNEVQNSLEAATNLRASFLRISSTASANSEELNWARNELKGTLAALDADLEDLEESVRIVEETGGRLFGVEEEEVMARRKYVVYVRNQIETMRKEVNSSVPNATSASQSAYSPVVGSGPQEDDQAEWSRLEQEMEVQRQDSTLDTISGTLHTLAAQANLIGHEVGEHNEMLSELEANVDRSDSKLSSAMKKMKHFIRETEETKSAQPTLPECQAVVREQARTMDAVRKTLIGATTPSFLGLTAGSAFLALSLRPAFVPLVLLLATLINYTRTIIKRPHFKHRFFALLSALSVATVAAFSSSAESALSTRVLSSALLLLAAAIFSLIALAPILCYARTRSYVGSRSPLAGILLFPALWTTTWALLVWASPLGRIGSWTPMTGIESYVWVTATLGQPGLDYITALWAVVVAEYAGEWLMGHGAEELVPSEASPNIDFLTPIEDANEDQNITGHANVSSTPRRISPTPYLIGLLILGMVPSYWTPVLPLPTHAPNSTEVTVSCVHPYVAQSGTPLLLEDYLAETRTQVSRAKIVLWPEGAVQFRSDKERDAAFAEISKISRQQKAWIGAAYEQTFSNSNETVLGKRVRGINALAIFGPEPDMKPVTYIKRRLVPLVETFSLESSINPPPRYPVALPKPNSRPNRDRHSWPRTIPVTAAICLDVSAPLETSVPVDDLPSDLGRPALILAPARTWHPDVGKAMFQHASARAIEQGASILWCDGGEGGVSGVGGLAAQGLGLLGGIGQVGGGGSWIQTIGVPFPYDAGNFGPTWYARWGDLSAIFFAWAVLTIGFAEPVVHGFGKLAGLIYYRLKRRGDEPRDRSQPNENTALLFDP